MLRDITLIFAFVVIGLALWQLRFSKSYAIRTLFWAFLIIIGVSSVMLLSNDLSREARFILDVLFWTAQIGLIATYLWQKRTKNKNEMPS